MTQVRDIIDLTLATAMHTMQTTIATMLAITTRRKQLVNDNLRCANKKQHQYDYALGQKAMKKVHDPTKLGGRTSGPYIVEHVHVNGTLSKELCPGFTKHINIIRVITFVHNTVPLVPSEGHGWAQA
eukprot:15356149-Ditylum_brightwellii.AAC.1